MLHLFTHSEHLTPFSLLGTLSGKRYAFLAWPCVLQTAGFRSSKRSRMHIGQNGNVLEMVVSLPQDWHFTVEYNGDKNPRQGFIALHDGDLL